MKELWFKCLQIYRLSRDVELNAEEMQPQLERFIFSPCGSQDMAKTGWVSPMGSYGGGQLVHSTGSQQILICVKKEEKNLPASVIKQELQAKVAQLESKQSRKLKKEKDSLKDEVLHTLLPRAFSRYSQTLVWIDAVNGLIMVAAGSAKKAEDVLALLRKTIGSLPVVPLTMESPIELALTEWVRFRATPVGFQLQDEAELKAILEEGGTIRCKKQSLVSDEIGSHIESGKLVTQLSLDWQCTFQERRYQYARLGMKAALLSKRLRKLNHMPSSRIDASEWSVQSVLWEQWRKGRKRRSKLAPEQEER